MLKLALAECLRIPMHVTSAIQRDHLLHALTYTATGNATVSSPLGFQKLLDGSLSMSEVASALSSVDALSDAITAGYKVIRNPNPARTRASCGTCHHVHASSCGAVKGSFARDYVPLPANFSNLLLGPTYLPRFSIPPFPTSPYLALSRYPFLLPPTPPSSQTNFLSPLPIFQNQCLF